MCRVDAPNAQPTSSTSSSAVTPALAIARSTIAAHASSIELAPVAQ